MTYAKELSVHYNRVFLDRRLSALSMMKLEAGCADCGYAVDPVALDFDHVRGTKLGAVGSMLNQSWTAILAEVDKCDVVCSNCHRIRTDQRRRSL